MDRTPKRGEKVMVKPELIQGKRYSSMNDNRIFDVKHEKLKGRVLTVRDTSGDIFDVQLIVIDGTRTGAIFNYAMVDLLSDMSEDALFDAFVMGGISQNEYEELRKERG